MIDGKIPPQAIDLEEAILGAILLEKNAINEISDILTSQMFYKDTHSMIYECMLYLNSTSNPIDLLTVSEQLRKNSELEKCGGVYYLSSLTDKIASSANIEYHSRIVIQKYMQREIIRISSESIKDAHEDTIDVFDLLDSITTSFMAIDELKALIDSPNIDKVVTKE
jgi:replicative DNA helicase